jgi:hypothetical protein
MYKKRDHYKEGLIEAKMKEITKQSFVELLQNSQNFQMVDLSLSHEVFSSNQP